jgi:hypothetical protein
VIERISVAGKPPADDGSGALASGGRAGNADWLGVVALEVDEGEGVAGDADRGVDTPRTLSAWWAAARRGPATAATSPNAPERSLSRRAGFIAG